jgi:molybdopterin molybdotransferase
MKTCDNQPGMMPLSQALYQMLGSISAVKQQESICLHSGLSRVVSQTVTAPLQVPQHDNSAMDGYAFDSCDLADAYRLKVQGKALAGHEFKQPLQAGHCVKIMTGAPIPQGCDTVVMQESTVASGDNHIHIQGKPQVGDNIRRAGSDIALGQNVLSVGEPLTAANMALLSSLGINHISVFRKLKVAILATGDELVLPGETLKTGQIYESNRTALLGLLAPLPVEIIDMGIIKDHPEHIKQALLTAAKQADLVISCGGVSVGEADYVKTVLNKIGNIHFWKVAIKPGKPFAFGQIDYDGCQAHFCGLPGNPVSSYVTFQQLVLPVIRKLGGQILADPILLPAITDAPIRKRAGRMDFQRGYFYTNEKTTQGYPFC